MSPRSVRARPETGPGGRLPGMPQERAEFYWDLTTGWSQYPGDLALALWITFVILIFLHAAWKGRSPPRDLGVD